MGLTVVVVLVLADEVEEVEQDEARDKSTPVERGGGASPYDRSSPQPSTEAAGAP